MYEQSSSLFTHGTYLKQTSPMNISVTINLLSHSHPCHTAIKFIAYRLISCHMCYKYIQLELSSFLVSLTSTLLSSSRPSLLFSWLSSSTVAADNCGQTYLNALLCNSWQVVSPSKQTSMYTRVQCSHTSVGFAQATKTLLHVLLDCYFCWQSVSVETAVCSDVQYLSPPF